MYYHPVRFNGTHDGDAVAVSNELHEQLFNVTADSAQPHVAAMHKILVPVDGSEGALRATAYVIGSVFRGAASEIHLLNVQPPLMTGEIGPLVTVEMVMRERLVAGHEALHRARALLDASGTPCTMAVHFGKPAETKRHALHFAIFQEHRRLATPESGLAARPSEVRRERVRETADLPSRA